MQTFEKALADLKAQSWKLHEPGGRSLQDDFAMERGLLTEEEMNEISERDKKAYPQVLESMKFMLNEMRSNHGIRWKQLLTDYIKAKETNSQKYRDLLAAEPIMEEVLGEMKQKFTVDGATSYGVQSAHSSIAMNDEYIETCNRLINGNETEWDLKRINLMRFE